MLQIKLLVNHTHSKRQNTVETSTFGSEFVAMRTAVKFLQSLRLKLQWMGVQIDGPANVFCDNNSVVKGASILKKRPSFFSEFRVLVTNQNSKNRFHE
jgi:hypothetical protein